MDSKKFSQVGQGLTVSIMGLLQIPAAPLNGDSVGEEWGT